MEYYQQTTDQALDNLSSSPEGLSTQQAKNVYDQVGPNALDVKGESLWHKITEPFRSVFMLILGIAAAVSIITGETLDAYIIIAIIAISAAIYYVQRVSTERVLKSLKDTDVAYVEVLRDRQPKQLPPEELVPGDVIRLYEGDKVPADARVILSDNARCDEALLTGESAPVAKQTNALEGEKQVYERDNVIFQGSFLVSGEVTAVVFATGNFTEFGQIAVLSQQTDLSSPVQEKIDKLVSQIVSIVVAFAAVIFMLSMWRGIEMAEALRFMLTISVSVIPEGLPIAISVILVLGMRRMAQRKALVRNMAAIENIGLITTVASDKTGTLTENKLRVQEIWQAEPKPSADETAAIMQLSTNQREGVSHDPLDTAFTEYVAEHNVDVSRYKLIRSLPFVQELALSGNIWEIDGQRDIYLKGSPEKILEHTSMTNSFAQEANQALEGLTGQGYRVIALGRVKDRDVEDLEELADDKFEFLGFLAVADELRAEAITSIEATQAAGVTVRMITGDHAETAYQIGKQLGLAESRDQVLDARKMDSMDEQQLSQAVANTRVFARVIPEQKHRILTELKKHDIAAMTGDGVNDVPALSNAHIGFAMGSGSQIAKDSGDFVLLDDNFSSITTALAEGRKIFDNIRRMLFYLLTTNAGEALTMLAALILGLPLPVLAVQILWINLATDTAFVIPLGLEPAEQDVMQRKPRHPKQPILGRVIISRMVSVAIVMAATTLALFIIYVDSHSEEYARSIAFSGLVIMQWANAFTARSEWQSAFTRLKTVNWTFYIGLLIAAFLQWLALFGPMQEPLSLEPVALNDLFITGALSAVVVLLAGEVHKIFVKKQAG